MTAPMVLTFGYLAGLVTGVAWVALVKLGRVHQARPFPSG